MSYDNMMQQALKLHQQGQLDEAEKLYRQILQTMPNNPKILNLLGLIAQAKGLHNEAVSFFGKAIINDFNNCELYFNLGWSLSALGKYNEAIEAYDKALKIKADIKEAYNALGEIYALTGNISKAETMFKKALVYAPNYPEAKINLAYLHQDLEQLLELNRLYPQQAPLLYDLALLYRNRGQKETALSFAEQAAKVMSVDCYFLLLGELALQCNKKDLALQAFQQALAYNHHSVDALINLANAETDEKKAETMYLQAIDLSPDNFDAHLNYANLLHKLKRFSEALEEYRRAVILNPQSPEVSNNLGILERDIGDLTAALGLFFNAFNLVPECNEYALNIAETLVMLHREQADTATKIAADWLSRCPQNEFAKHINAAFKGEKIGNNFEYSRRLFDLFADNYEQTMSNINYEVPQKIADCIGQATGTIVDLGCGTGLLGEKIKNENNRLIGVDISAQMLEKAREKNIYDQLIEADILDYCKHMPVADMVTAADVLGYMGDLAPLAQKVFPRAFIFSAALNEQVADFTLIEGGRYVYNPEYIEQTLQQAGYTNIRQKSAVLRRENGKNVNGAIFEAKEK